jgi:hypothetical protein
MLDELHWAIARQIWRPDATLDHRSAAKGIVLGRMCRRAIETLAAQATPLALSAQAKKDHAATTSRDSTESDADEDERRPVVRVGKRGALRCVVSESDGTGRGQVRTQPPFLSGEASAQGLVVLEVCG